MTSATKPPSAHCSGAVEALEDGSGAGGHPPPGEVPESVITAGHLPNGPGPGAETEGW